MRYRIIALDVDGTLLNDDHQLSDRNRNTVLRAASLGALIVLCTGRSPQNTLPLMKELGLDGVAITHNGAVTVRAEGREVLHTEAFFWDDIRSYVDYCRSVPALHFDCCTPFDLYVERLPTNAKNMYAKFELRPIQVESVQGQAPFVKMSCFGEKPDIDKLQDHWERHPGRLTTIRSHDMFIDVMHPKATKGNALRHLAAELGVPREQILAIGNYFNDQEMIEFAGMGIAVANSPDELKQAADRVTRSNNEDGVHFAIEEHVFGDV